MSPARKRDKKLEADEKRLEATGSGDESATEAATAPEAEASQDEGGEPHLADEGVGEAPPEDEAPAEAPKTRDHLKHVVESLIFVSDQLLTALQIARIVKAKSAEVRELAMELQREYEGRGIELVEVNGGFQFRSAAASAPFVRDLVAQKPVRLTRAQLETLALVAYRQPITRPEVDEVRGVDTGSAIKVLLERDLLRILGRKDEPGRPLLYGTTPHFLEFFGMKTLQDLPTLREFTELSEENRELFKRKTGELPDLSTEEAGSRPLSELPTDTEEEAEATLDDEELLAVAEAARKQAGDESEASAQDDG